MHILCTQFLTHLMVMYHPNNSLSLKTSVLAAKGVDASEVDKRVERKASVARLTGKLFFIPHLNT